MGSDRQASMGQFCLDPRNGANPGTVFLLIGFLLCMSKPAQGGLVGCFDSQGLCSEPCPAEHSCFGDSDCDEGEICVPALLPPYCYCMSDGRWDCGNPEGILAWECIVLPDLGPPTYTIVELGTLGGPSGVAHSVNNYGQVVGEADTPNGRRHAFLSEGGKIIDLTPEFIESSSFARDINNLGQIVISGGYLWLNGKLTQMAFFNPQALNDFGHVVGHSISGTPRPLLWHEGILTNLEETLGLSAVGDINNSGHLAGTISVEGNWHAAIWGDARLIDLGTLGGLISFGIHVNDLGHVVGSSERAPGGDRRFYPFFWDGGQLMDVRATTGQNASNSSTYTLNNCDEILLIGDGPSRGTEYYLYQTGGRFRPVRGVTRPHSDWVSLSPRKINDRGQVVGVGTLYGLRRPFLMSPLPGDLDGDGDRDLADAAGFHNAFTGPHEPRIPGCERADLDLDADVDLDDWTDFERRMEGPE
jgi:probable HAF family extracellular repeat protein